MLLSAACFSGARPAPPLSTVLRTLCRPRPQLRQKQQRWMAASSRGGGSGSGSSSGSSSELQPSTPEQAAAADRLVMLSREASQHRRHTWSSDEQLRQRILLLLQLGFSEAAIEKHIRNSKGGPYIAWAAVGELVALLRREGFSQQHLDGLLAGTNKSDNAAGSTYTRAPVDVEANLAWLRQQFGLKPADLAKACSRSPDLLGYKAETLQANWRAIVEAYHPTAAAMPGLVTALRAGFAHFLLLTPATVGNKIEVLQELLGLPGAKLRDRLGSLAVILSLDLHATDDGPVQRFELLQELTGLPKDKLWGSILHVTGLLSYTSEALLRKHDAIVQALSGDATAAKLLLSRYPDALSAADDRVPRNLAALQRLGCSSPQVAAQVLVANGRLAKLDLERPAFAARVAYWQQAYGLERSEAAMLKCDAMLHRSLRTVAPRVAFWRSFWPGQPLAHCDAFALADAAFCRRQRLPTEQFPDFKQRWLASEEGRQVCRHERQQDAAPAGKPDLEPNE